MSKINQIQNALKELDGGQFQKLCDSYLAYKGYKNLNPLGSVRGANKVRKGTPDTFIRQANGRFVFVEYTTQQDGVIEKFKDDLAKCLDESKTGIPTKDIAEIILCHTSRFTAEEESEIYNEAKKHGIKTEFHGIESLSFDLYRYYPGIARDFLNVNIDSGQILTPAEFTVSYDKSQYATPLETTFHFREKEVQEALAHLRSNDFLLIAGAAGVGKSRISLEIIKQYIKEYPEYEPFCVRARGQDLFEDLQVYFSRPGNFLILVDDANRIGKFDYIVHLLLDKKPNQQIKVIATVRDYAVQKIRESARHLCNVTELTINAFEKKEIKELLQKLYNIQNDLWLERITQVAGGNPRLALMATQIAIKDDNLNSIRDVSSLYDRYFASIREDLSELNDPNILKVAGIISLFRNIDKSNEQLMGLILGVFGIDTEIFWAAALRLHEYELVDIFENEVVKISDQVLATYLFYLCVFKTKTINLELLLENFFPSQINRIRDSIYPCVNSFGFEELVRLLQPAIKARFIAYQQQGDTVSLYQLMEVFWFILQTETLEYVHNLIESIAPENLELDSVSWEASNSSPQSNSVLPLLARFANAEESQFLIALELACRFAEKDFKAVPDFLRLLKEGFGFNRHSHRYDYSYQRSLIDKLIEKTENGKNLFFSKLFLAISEYYLRTRFDNTESDHRAMTIHQFRLLSVPVIFKLREKIWNQIFALYENPLLQTDVLRVIRSYNGAGYYVDNNEIIKRDSEFVIRFFAQKLSPEKFSNCLVVHSYFKLLGRREIEGDKEVLTLFTGEAYKLYKILSFDLSDKVHEKMSLEEYESFVTKRIAKYTKNFDFGNWKSFLSSCLEIHREMGSDHEKHNFVSGIFKAFIELANSNSQLYAEVISYYLSLGDPIPRLMSPLFVEKLIKATNTKRAFEIIEVVNYPTKRQWQFAYQQALAVDQIGPNDIERLYELYKTSGIWEIPRSCDYLLSYQKHDKNFVTNVVEIICKRAEQQPDFGYCIDYMFNPYSDFNKQIISLFKERIDVLKNAYLVHEKVDRHADFDGTTMNRILDIDPNFLQEHINSIYNNKDYPSRYDDSRNYSFLWKRNDVDEIISAVIKQMVSKEVDRGFIRGSYLQRLFCVDEHNPASLEVMEAEDKFLTKFIPENVANSDTMSLIFGTIAHFDVDRRRKLIGLFLQHNKKFADFEILPLEPDTWGWSGSAVPVIAARIAFWESLLPLCNSVDFLSHRKLIEGHAAGLQKYLAAEKKSDFISDD